MGCDIITLRSSRYNADSADGDGHNNNNRGHDNDKSDNISHVCTSLAYYRTILFEHVLLEVYNRQKWKNTSQIRKEKFRSTGRADGLYMIVNVYIACLCVGQNMWYRVCISVSWYLLCIMSQYFPIESYWPPA